MELNKSIYNLYYEWWKNIDKLIFSLIFLLFLTGLFFSLVSTSLLVSDKLDTNDYAFFLKHLSFVFLGLIIIFFLSSISEDRLLKISPTNLEGKTIHMTSKGVPYQLAVKRPLQEVP